MRNVYAILVLCGISGVGHAQRPPTSTPTPTPRPTATPRPTPTPRPTFTPAVAPPPATIRAPGGSFNTKPAAGSLTNQIGAGSLGTTMQVSPNASTPSSGISEPTGGSFNYGAAPVVVVPSDDDGPTTRNSRRGRLRRE